MVRVVLVLIHTLVLVVAGANAPARAAEDPVGSWPLHPEPDVVAGFDPPADPWGEGHRGVDLAGHIGQVVMAARPGVVAFAGRIAGKGVVSVAHDDGTRTTYEPVAATVERGDPVSAGAPLGRLEVAFSHCFPAACLHWGWLRGETYLDPLLLVGGGPVRLLPLWRDEPATVDARVALPYVGWTSALGSFQTLVGGRPAQLHP